ncbi:MAG: DUF3108 domain-containing protein [Acidobacteria bacterium]|nr:DUF3108 domain-containing protein [Acidobacteriota bacterium]
MRAVSLCAGAMALVATLHLVAAAAQGGARQPSRRPAPPTKKAAPAPAPAPRQEAAVPFRVGETLTFDVAWSNYLVAGTATSRVVEKRSSYNSTAYYIVAEGRPIPLVERFYQVYYKMDSLLDSYSTLSQRSSLYSEEGSRRSFASTLFNRSAGRATYEEQNQAAVQLTVPANVQDGLATLYTLRSRTFTAGDSLTVPVADEGSLYSVRFDVGAPAPLKVPIGQVEAWPLRVTIRDASNQPVGQNVAAWISTDARRLPLKLQADLPVGNFALALRSAQ